MDAIAEAEEKKIADKERRETVRCAPTERGRS